MGPDFLGIGAQKSGTTWLHENLSRHPGIWMPPVKEIHFLDHDPPSLLARLFGRREYLSGAREHLMKVLEGSVTGKSGLADLDWAARFCLSGRTDRWYGQLFQPAPGQIAGEICPGYARMTSEQIERARRLLPRAKIIYFLRDPVERAWSAAAMHFRSTRGTIKDVSEAEIKQWLSRPRIRRHSAYLENLARWQAHFPPAQIFVGFYDELAQDPIGLLVRIFTFLEVDYASHWIASGAEVRRNEGKGEIMPDSVARVLSAEMLPAVRELHGHFHCEHTARWLNKAETAVATRAEAISC